MKKLALFMLLVSGAVAVAAGDPKDTKGFNLYVDNLRQSLSGRVGPNMFNSSHVGAAYISTQYLKCTNTLPSDETYNFKSAYCSCVVDARVANAGGVGKPVKDAITPEQVKLCTEAGVGAGSVK